MRFFLTLLFTTFAGSVTTLPPAGELFATSAAVASVPTTLPRPTHKITTLGATTLPASTTLAIEVQNVRKATGKLHVALFKPSADFPDDKPVANQILPVQAGAVRTTFAVEPGQYAVAVFQDLNGNGKLDTGTFGIPKEPYGFSNNFRPRFSGPKFKDCQIDVGDAGQRIAIKLL